MRISDWSSDVCSSDLPWLPEPVATAIDDPARAAELADEVSMALLIVLESLPPLARAAFVMTDEIGRASCRARACQNVWISVVAVSLTINNPIDIAVTPTYNATLPPHKHQTT